MYLQRVAFVICMTVLLAIIHAPQPISASEPDVLALYQLVQQGEGDAALALVTTVALERGGWGPAPGDIVVYDPQLPRYTRGKIKVVDQRPVECESPRLSRFMDNCDWDPAIRRKFRDVRSFPLFEPAARWQRNRTARFR